MFTRLDSRATIARSNIAGEMHDLQCWPALQGVSYTQHDAQPQPAISTCNDLVPHIIRLVDEQSDLKILKVYDAKPMTYDTIDRVAAGHGIFKTITDNKGRSARVRQSLKHDNKIYVRGKGHYKDPLDIWSMNPDALTYGDKGAVIVPNSEPFTCKSHLRARTRILDLFSRSPIYGRYVAHSNASGPGFWWRGIHRYGRADGTAVTCRDERSNLVAAWHFTKESGNE